MVEGFSKMYNLSLFGHFVFCKHFSYITNFEKKSVFANLLISLQILTEELSDDASFVIFGHQTWDLEGGVKLTSSPLSASSFSSYTLAGIGLRL